MKKIIFTLFIIHCSLLIANAQWQPDVRLTNNPAYSFTSFNNAWCVASSGTFVHVVLFDTRDGNNEIYYKRSTDSGVNWGGDTRLTNNAATSQYRSVAVSGSFVHVVWMDYRDGSSEIYYECSTDAGVSWSADTRLTNNDYASEFPSVAVSGSVVHVVWKDRRDFSAGEIYYKRSTDSGVSWGTDIRLTNNFAYSYFPSVSVSSSAVHVVWHDFRDLDPEIYYKRSTDAGVSWGADTRLTNNDYASEFPSIAVSGTFVHVVWMDRRDGNEEEIYYKQSKDGGNTWSSDIRLTYATDDSNLPSVAVSGSAVYVVWRDYHNGNMEIYYKRSTDGGVNWGADTRLTNNSANSGYPSVAVSGSVVHVVWEDERDGNYEIYYKRDPTGNTIGIKNITSEIPSSYSLSQNYPNPFNPTTKIKFDIAPSLSFPNAPIGNPLVVLKVYDILGKEIQTLMNKKLNPGTYEATFDGSNLQSGIYFYQLKTGDFMETKKIILLK